MSLKLRHFLVPSIISIITLLFAATQVNASINYQAFNVNDYTNKPSDEEKIEEIAAFAKSIYHELGECQGPKTKDFKKDIVYCPNIFEAERVRLAYLGLLAAVMTKDMVDPSNQFVMMIDTNPGGDQALLDFGEGYTPDVKNTIYDNNYKYMVIRLLYTTAINGVSEYDGDEFWKRIGNLNPLLDANTVILGKKIGDYNLTGTKSGEDTNNAGDSTCSNFAALEMVYLNKAKEIYQKQYSENKEEIEEYVTNGGLDWVKIEASTVLKEYLNENCTNDIEFKKDDVEDNKVIVKNNYKAPIKGKDGVVAAINNAVDDYSLQNYYVGNTSNVTAGTTGTEIDPRFGIFLASTLSNVENVHVLFNAADSSIKNAWLPFTDTEKEYYFERSNSLEDPKDSLSQYYYKSSACLFRGVQALVLCAPTRFMANTATGGMTIIGDSLRLKSEIFVKTSKQSGSVILHDAWNFFRNLSNIILIIIFMIMIFGTMTNFRNGKYHFRRMLPRLAVFSLLINLSYFLITATTDVSNVIGDSLASLLSSFGDGDYKTILMTLAGEVLAGTGTFLIFGSGVFTAALFIPIVIVVFLTVLFTYVMLAIRDAIFVILVLLMPLMLATLITSSSNRAFSLWSKTFITIIMFYPMASALIGGAGFVAQIMSQSGGFVKLFSPLPIVMSYIALPQLLITMTKQMPIIGAKVGSLMQSLPQNARASYEKTNFHKQVQQAHLNRQRQFQRGNQSLLQKARHKVNDGITRGVGTADNLLTGELFRDAISNKKLNITEGRYFDYNASVPEIDEKAFDQILNDGTNKTKFGENTSQAIIRDIIANDTSCKANGDNYFQSDLGRVSLNSAEQTQANILVNSSVSDPNIILSAMISMADNGHGDFDDLRRASLIYLQRGGDSELLRASLKTMDKMYEKENKQAPAALIRQLYKRVEKTNGATLEQALRGQTQAGAQPGNQIDFVLPRQAQAGETTTTVATELENKRVDIISESFLDRTNWSKFNGYNASSIEHRAFADFINGFSAGNIRNQQIDRIAESVTSKQGLDYLNKFRS